MSKISPNYQHSMVIVHGKSEHSLCSCIKSNLHLPGEIVAERKGKCSIQITSLRDYLNRNEFKTFYNFHKKFDMVHAFKGELIDFKLFVIMDVDDCSIQQKQSYIQKTMFSDHWLKNYIVPIVNDPNLEETMTQAGIPVHKKKDYITIFPTSHGDMDIGQAEALLEKIKRCSCTNLGDYLGYCLDWAKKSAIHTI